MFVVLRGLQIPPWPAIHDDLTSQSSRRLQQDRIHIRHRFQTTRFSLGRLCPANFAAIDANHRVVRHVLRFEWDHPMSQPQKVPADRRRHPAFPCVRSGSTDENGLSGHKKLPFALSYSLGLPAPEPRSRRNNNMGVPSEPSRISEWTWNARSRFSVVNTSAVAPLATMRPDSRSAA